MTIMDWAIVTTVAAVLLAWSIGIARPRSPKDGEHAFERGAFPLFYGRPGTSGTVSALVTAASSAVAVAEAVRYRHDEPGICELDVVVPWTHVEPWNRRRLQADLEVAVEAVKPVGVIVRAKVTWR